MEIKLEKVGIVVLVAALTLGMLIGVQFSWKRFMLEDPTMAKLKAVQGVSAVDISSQRPQQVVDIKLNAVENFKQTCQDLLAASGTSQIQIDDNRSAQLQALLEDTRFTIEEAIARGTFTSMQQAIDTAAKNAKLDRYGVYMDNDYIYLEFHKGNSNLYQVFPRNSGNQQIVTKG